MFDVRQRQSPGQESEPRMGCALAMLGVNTVLIGLATVSFTQGPYSSREQEFWYRYGSLAFFVAGSILPGIALFADRRSRVVIGASIAWMAATFLAFVRYAMMSSGGV
jgi:hypothetical protein